ncbi:MAG: NUDIX hydrolase [Pseudomonadota bacterium]
MDAKELAAKAVRVSVGAVVFRGDEVLLIKRGKPPFLGAWSIPGGKVEHDERLHDAVAREVREETGVEMALIGLIDVFETTPSARGDGTDYHMVMVDYAARWVAGEPVAADDASAAEFVAVDVALDRLSWDETRRALQMALRLRLNGDARGA